MSKKDYRIFSAHNDLKITKNNNFKISKFEKKEEKIFESLKFVKFNHKDYHSHNDHFATKNALLCQFNDDIYYQFYFIAFP